MSTTASSAPVQSHATSRRGSSLEISGWRDLHSNGLIGAFDVRLPSGMIILGCLVYRKAGAEPHLILPGAPTIDADGKARRGGDGKVLYKTLIKFDSTEVFKRFETLILDELRRIGHI